MAATYSVYVDWNNDGDFSDTGEDVSARTLERTTLTIRYGRDQARALAPISPGEAELELDNRSRDYSPENSSSPLVDNVLPGRPVYVKATLSAVDYPMFRGHLDDYNVMPNISDRTVRFSCLDPLAKLRGVRVTTELHNSVSTGEAVGILLDAAGWDPALRDLDPGSTTIPWFWLDDADAFDALLQIADSEGPGSLVTVDSAGAIVFRSRHHRITAPASTTSQATFRDTGTEPNHSAPLVYDHGWSGIVNTVTLSVPIRAVSGELSAVWSSQGQISLAEGETIAITAKASNPFFGALTPVAGTDYTLLSGTVTVALSATSGQSTTVSITAAGGAAVITGLQVRAYEVSTVTTRVIKAENTTSIGQYGPRSLPSAREPVWAHLNDAVAIAELILAQRAERLPTVTITIRGGNDTRLVQQLSRDLSDRITIVDAETGLNSDFHIEQIQHAISDAGAMLTTSFGCEKIPDPITDLLILNDAVRGLLGTGRLGGVGTNEPDVMFVLDDATQGVLGDSILAY